MAETLISSYELQEIVKSARERARRSNRPVTSVGILFAACYVPVSECLPVLTKVGIALQGEGSLTEAAARLKEKLEKGRGYREPEDTLKVMHQMACETAARYGIPVLNSAFYLLALLRIRKSLAFQVLEEGKADVFRLRSELHSRLTALAATLSLAEGGEEDPGRSGVDGAVQSSPSREEGGASNSRSEEGHHRVSPGPESVPSLSPTDGNGTSPGPQTAQQTGAAEGGTGGESKADDESLSRYTLDPDQFPLLAKLTRNITLDAISGRIDPVIGRSQEIEEMIRILRKRRTNNPVLVGDPGVGKTALVEGLALDIVQKVPRARWLEGRILLSLETGALVAGTQLRGSFSEKMRMLRDEVKKADGRIIVFIDEIHTLVGAGGGESALDAANELKTVLARGEFPCIGATTLKEYKTHIEKDAALERRLQPVFIKEPSPAEAIQICQGVLGFYEKHHEVSYSERAVESAVRFSSRYMVDRKLPDKAIDVLDTAGALAFLHGRYEVTEEEIARVVAEKVGIPLERMLLDSGQRLATMEAFLRNRIVGHRDALLRICETIRRGFAGFAGQRPMATFLFAGPMGMGKTQTAKALAEFLFDASSAFQVFNMNEFTEKHSVAKLIGTGPGYVGHEQGGRLTESMYRRPFQLIMFRDLQLAHPDVQALVMELVKTGVLTDGKGHRVYFSNAVVVLSVDLEVDDYFAQSAGRVGFRGKQEEPTTVPSEDILKRLSRKFPGDVVEGVDEALVFYPLTSDQVMDVARLEVSLASNALKEERDIQFELEDSALNQLIQLGAFTASGGGRRMKQVLSRNIEALLADRMISGEVKPGTRCAVYFEDQTFGVRQLT